MRILAERLVYGDEATEWRHRRAIERTAEITKLAATVTPNPMPCCVWDGWG